MYPLGRLITERMNMHNPPWGSRQVEKQAKAMGHPISKSTVQGLQSKMTPQISRKAVFGLAAGLGVTPLTIAMKALESWGLDVHPVEVTDSLATIDIDPTLSEQDRQNASALIRQMRAQSQSQWQSSDKGEGGALRGLEREFGGGQVENGNHGGKQGGRP